MAQEQGIFVESDWFELDNIGMSAEAVSIGGKEYAMHLPSIISMQKIGEYLAQMATSEMSGKTLDEAVRMMTDKQTMAKAVSYILQGDELLVDELSNSSSEELQEAIIIYHGMTIQSMKMLKRLAESVGKLIGKQKSF
ncbi:MAG: hypothetical protein IJ640_00645 [Prevotella sp.]|nr:hypothetical protein [Prevotella sp.]